jgi:hypothetical protein
MNAHLLREISRCLGTKCAIENLSRCPFYTNTRLCADLGTICPPPGEVGHRLDPAQPSLARVYFRDSGFWMERLSMQAGCGAEKCLIGDDVARSPRSFAKRVRNFRWWSRRMDAT